MTIQYNNSAQVTSEKIQWKRENAATKIVDFERVKQKHSQRQFAKDHGVPRTTLQHWLSRKDSLDASPVLISFFESPEGNAFLHRLVTAAHFEFTKHGVASIHNVSNFLELSGLTPFIASSYSTQCRVSKKMDNTIIDFEECERPRLSRDMPSKKISLCEDETFHPDICMVAMEPVSNFIIAEKYVENREGKTWDNVVKEALYDLPVEVIQVASDEGRGLINHITKGLKAHHSSDCFHVSHEIGKGTSGALASVVKKAEKEYETAVKQTQERTDLKENYDNQLTRPRGRRPHFEKKIELASEREVQAETDLLKAKQNQEIVRTDKAEIGKLYHPYNPETGEKQDALKVSDILEACFERINGAIIGLSDRSKSRVDKAHRVVKNMVANIAFFYHMINLYLDNYRVSEWEKLLMHEYLIPGFYLQKVAGKEKDAERKAIISRKSQELLAILTDRDGPLASYCEDDIKRLVKAAEECAHLFQRSSSCVEGRNAQLSLRHHGIHRLSDRHLKAQTIVHNYYVKRRDGTTAAERFFDAKHKNLFEWLLENMDYPARPRKRRANAALAQNGRC